MTSAYDFDRDEFGRFVQRKNRTEPSPKANVTKLGSPAIINVLTAVLVALATSSIIMLWPRMSPYILAAGILLVAVRIADLLIPKLLRQYHHFQSARQTRKRYRRLVNRTKNQPQDFDFEEEVRKVINK